ALPARCSLRRRRSPRRAARYPRPCAPTRNRRPAEFSSPLLALVLEESDLLGRDVLPCLSLVNAMLLFRRVCLGHPLETPFRELVCASGLLTSVAEFRHRARYLRQDLAHAILELQLHQRLGHFAFERRALLVGGIHRDRHLFGSRAEALEHRADARFGPLDRLIVLCGHR